MRCLSLWQPWASGMAAGLKRIETRGKRTHLRGEFAIHAALKWSGLQAQAAMQLLSDVEGFAQLGGAGQVAAAAFVQDARSWPRGCVLAVVDVVGCEPVESLAPDERERRWGDYSPGRFGYLTENVRMLERPLPLKGQQGVWTLSEAEEACVRAFLPGGSPTLTPEQRQKLEHALGLDYPDKVKNGRTWRRHYVGEGGDQDLEHLVALGLMERGAADPVSSSNRWYFATVAGQRACGIREVAS